MAKYNSLLAVLCLFFFNLSLSAQRVDFNELNRQIKEAKTNYDKANAYVRLGTVMSGPQSDMIEAFADSILALSTPDNPEYYKAASDFLMGMMHQRKRAYQQAKPYFKRAEEVFREENPELSFQALNLLGTSHLFSSELDSAIYLFNDMLERVGPEDIGSRVMAHGNLGGAYQQTGKYGLAMQHFEKVLELDSGNDFNTVNVSMKIARMFFDMGLYDKGINTLRNLDLTQFPDNPVKAAYYSSLANFYRKTEANDSAFYYWEQSLNIDKKFNRPGVIFIRNLNIAANKLELNRADEAKVYLDDARRVYGNPQVRTTEKARFQISTGRYYIQRSQSDSAVYHFNQGLELAKSSNFERLRVDLYKGLADAYEQKGETDRANEFLKKHNEYSLKLLDDARERFLAEAKANYLLAVSEAELEESNEKITRIYAWQIILAITLVITGVGLFIYFRNYRKSSSSLSEQLEVNEALGKTIEKQKVQMVELKSKAVLEAEQIVAIKSDSHYLEFYLTTKEKPEIDRNTIKNVLSVLPDYFMQVHKSYIINIKAIKVKYADKVEMKTGIEIPVSRTFKGILKEALARLDAPE